MNVNPMVLRDHYSAQMPIRMTEKVIYNDNGQVIHAQFYTEGKRYKPHAIDDIEDYK